MKKINYLLFSLISLFVFSLSVKAAPSYSFNVKSTVENGKSVVASVTVSGTAAWNIKIISAGATAGCSNSWADATSNGGNTTKTFSTTCRATSLGSITFTLSGDITSSDGANIGVSGTKKVTVVEPRAASTVNSLKSLSVEGFEISPEFDADTLEYSVKVPSTVEKIKIIASKKDGYSTVEGDGEKEVEEGINRVEVKVTSESGETRVYVVNVDVEDLNPINVSVNGKSYTVVKSSKNLEIPNNYLETTVNISGVDVVAFKNEITNITLVALKDESGNVNYFIYDNGKYEKYIELSSNILVLSPLDVDKVLFNNFKIVDKSINGNNIKVLQYKNLDKYYVIYAMDVNSGEYNYYLYDSINSAYQLFNEELFNDLVSDANFYLYMLCGAGVLIILCMIIILSMSKRRKKVAKIPKNAIFEDNLDSNEKVVLEEKQEEVIEDKVNEVKIEEPVKEEKKKNKKKKKEKNKEVQEEIKEEVIKEDTEEFYDIFEDDKKKRESDLL